MHIQVFFQNFLKLFLVRLRGDCTINLIAQDMSTFLWASADCLPKWKEASKKKSEELFSWEDEHEPRAHCLIHGHGKKKEKIFIWLYFTRYSHVVMVIHAVVSSSTFHTLAQVSITVFFYNSCILSSFLFTRLYQVCSKLKLVSID